MKIGIDASRANKTFKTGTEWYSYYVIKQMAEIDQETDFILYSPEKLVGGLSDLGPKVKNAVLNWLPKRFWTQIRLSYEMFKRPPEVLFIPAHAIPLIHPKNTITTIHDVGFEHFPELYSQKSLWYHRFSVRFALKHCKKVIAISKFTKQELIDKFKADPEKIVVINNGFNNERYRVIDAPEKINEILDKYKIKKPFIMSIGRLEEKKNTAGIIEAFKLIIDHWPKYKDLQLVLIGNKGYGFEKVLSLIGKYDLSHSVNFPGWVEEEDLPYLLNAAQAFVFPSFYEGFGIPILEAMACGCPVITSNFGATKEVAGNTAILVDPKLEGDIAQGIISVLENQALREYIIKKGIERAKQFSWEKCAQETLETLKS